MIWFPKLIAKYENTSFYKKKLIRRYKSKISPGIKSVDEMLTSLKKYFDMVEADKKEISDAFWELCVLDELNHYSNKNLDFCIYKIIFNEKSRLLYEENDENIFVILEISNEFFISNNRILEAILIIERGISETDYNMDNDILINYLGILKDYQFNKLFLKQYLM